MISGRPSNHCSPSSRLNPKEGAPASQIVPPSVASSSCCGRGVPGGFCPQHSAAAAARPAGDDCATGSRPGLGAAPRAIAQLARRRGRCRLVASERGLPERPGKKGGGQTGPNPVDRGKPGSKYHLVVDRNGIPLAVRLSAANAHDATQLLPLVDAIPPIIGPRGKPGRPRKRPAKLHADKAYDASDLRRALRARSITPRVARRGIDSSERLGRYRWVVERTFSWLLGCRRLGIRYERRADLLQGLLHLACALICLNFLAR